MRWLDMPPVWLAGFVGLSYWLRMPEAWETHGPGARILAVVLIGTGIALLALSTLQFRNHKTTIIPHRQPNALITHGVYRLSRNPIYLADVLILLGAILWLKAINALILVPIFMAVLEWRFIRPEEARLKAKFGAEFTDWAARVRRWV
ncbi:isoprenylcysteine carboxylmethyltransferase family protein [Pseudorhodobacter sp.]|uniref:methyltransferase family protein n=1 Tax=Pseudorhodobacter sp. TaxID=1934400 RepID=UPI002AFEBFC7|nr:isoprenylcysteine carboxylmethyltransferase family protein [Pseudorhodobacter sp.]